MDIEQLTALFRRLGAEEPASWARSQIAEGIPQLARFVFLRQAWRNVVSEEDTTWIDASIAGAKNDPAAPYAGSGRALDRLRALGAADHDLTDLVRGIQAELLHHLCYLLDDGGEIEKDVDVRWQLVQTNDDGEVVGDMGGLHEDMLELDPTGRGMRPRP